MFVSSLCILCTSTATIVCSRLLCHSLSPLWKQSVLRHDKANKWNDKKGGCHRKMLSYTKTESFAHFQSYRYNSITLWTDLAWRHDQWQLTKLTTAFSAPPYRTASVHHVVNTIMRMRAFSRKNGRLYARLHNGGSAGSLQRSGFRENPTIFLTFVAR